MLPKISIITPSYNQCDFIEQTILSVLSQGYPNLEYIIMDGGSTDNTVEIIKKYESRITHWQSEKDGGMYDAIYNGIEISTGDIIGWINSDDIYLPKSFFTIAEIFSKYKDVSWLEGANSHIDELGRIISTFQAHYLTKYDFICGNIKPIQQESTFFRRKLWIESGKPLNRKSQLAGDFELWVSFFKHSNLHYTTAPIGCFRYRSSNQKSFTFKKEYKQEVRQTIKINRNKTQGLNFYGYFVLLYMGFFKILQLFKLDIWVKQKIFNSTKIIKFDRVTQQFLQ